MSQGNSPHHFAHEQEAFAVQVPFILSLPVVSEADPKKMRIIELSGHTRRISRDVLELVGPFMLLSQLHLIGKNHQFQLMLGLPDCSIRLYVMAVNYAQLDKSETGVGYLMSTNAEELKHENDLNCVIKARITSITQHDRVRLADYFLTLRRQEEVEQTVMILESNGTWSQQTLTVTVVG